MGGSPSLRTRIPSPSGQLAYTAPAQLTSWYLRRALSGMLRRGRNILAPSPTSECLGRGPFLKGWARVPHFDSPPFPQLEAASTGSGRRPQR